MKISDSSMRCDRCGREAAYKHDEEHQEFLHIAFRGGYGSEFGDGNIIKGDFCQHCVKDLLGPYLTIIEGEPCKSSNEVLEPCFAYQPNQLPSHLKSSPSPMPMNGLSHEKLLDMFQLFEAMVEQRTDDNDESEQDSVRLANDPFRGVECAVLTLRSDMHQELALLRTLIGNLERQLRSHG
jgi:hypothetical protein